MNYSRKTMDNVFRLTEIDGHDIRNMLNKHGGRAGNVVQTYYTKWNKANIWARFKPVRSKSLFFSQSEWAEKGRSGDFGEAESFGFLIPAFDSPKKIKTALENGTAIWEYMRPDGKVYPYRMGDWRGYNPNAVNPIGDLANKVILHKTTTSFYFEINVEVVVSDVESEYNLCLSDFSVNGIKFSEMYLGVYLKRNDGKVFFQTGDEPIGNNNLSTTISADSGSAGEYKAYLFLSSKPQIGDGQEAYFVSINKDGVSFVIEKSEDYGVPSIYVEASWYPNSGVITDIVVLLDNESDRSFTYENITVNLLKVEDRKKPEETEPMSPFVYSQNVVVQVGGEEYINFKDAKYTNMFREDGYKYYIMAYANGVSPIYVQLDESQEES